MAIQPYPIDFDGLSKGDVISVAQIEEILGILASHPRFRLRALKIRDKIAAALDDRGKPATVVLRREGIRVLSDLEAQEYNTRHARSKLRGYARAYKRGREVDLAGLDEATRRKHERNLIYQGRVLQAIRATRAELSAPSPHQRQTPGLPPPETKHE